MATDGAICRGEVKDRFAHFLGQAIPALKKTSNPAEYRLVSACSVLTAPDLAASCFDESHDGSENAVAESSA
jgi:hypothetical protein